MAAHRYWRILFTDGYQASGDIDLGWVKFFTTADLDATAVAAPASTGGTAISGENYSSSYLPAKSFTYTNPETSAGWASLSSTSGYGSTKWIGYDFGGSPVEILAYSIAVYSSYFPKSWQFQYSDNSTTWTTVDTRTNVAWATTTSQFFRCASSVTGAGHRYWRLLGTGSGTIQSIGEIALRATSGGANLLNVYSTAEADSANGQTGATSSYTASKAVDGNTGALSYSWRSASDTGDHWWMADFGKNVQVVEAVLTSGPSAEWRGTMKLQSSDNRTTWKDRGTFSTPTAAYQQQTLTVGPESIGRRRPVIVCM